MRRQHTLCFSAALALLLTYSFVSSSARPAPAESDVAILVHPNNPVKNLTLAELRRIYRGERQYWNTNLPIVPLMRAPGARERDVVLRVIFQMSESQYTQYWVAKVMRAEVAAPPADLPSRGMVKESTSGILGAIAYVSVGEVLPGAKIVRIDGHLPGETGYPLR